MGVTRTAKSRPEIEIKLKVESEAGLKRRLKLLGFRRTSARRFESNHLFDFPDHGLRRTGRLLRLRLEKGLAVVTFKGPPARSKDFKVREEIESPVPSGDQLRRIFWSLGLRETFCYQKFRTRYVPPRSLSPRGHAELVFDETPIGNYVELEGPRGWIDRVARSLGYRRDDYITASYADLYFQWCRRHHREPGNMVFRRPG